MRNIDLEQRILAHVSRPEYQPVKSRVIARQMRLSEPEASQVRVSVKRLVLRGKLAWGPRHAVCPTGTPHLSSESTPASKPEPSGGEQPAGRRSISLPKPDESVQEQVPSRSRGTRPAEGEQKTTAQPVPQADAEPTTTDRPPSPGRQKKSAKPSSSAERPIVRGTFRRTSVGYGFVRPQGSTATDRSEDIYCLFRT